MYMKKALKYIDLVQQSKCHQVQLNGFGLLMCLIIKTQDSQFFYGSQIYSDQNQKSCASFSTPIPKRKPYIFVILGHFGIHQVHQLVSWVKRKKQGQKWLPFYFQTKSLRNLLLISCSSCVKSACTRRICVPYCWQLVMRYTDSGIIFQPQIPDVLLSHPVFKVHGAERVQRLHQQFHQCHGTYQEGLHV